MLKVHQVDKQSGHLDFLTYRLADARSGQTWEAKRERAQSVPGWETVTQHQEVWEGVVGVADEADYQPRLCICFCVCILHQQEETALMLFGFAKIYIFIAQNL